jgi:hypothetical protein
MPALNLARLIFIKGYIISNPFIIGFGGIAMASSKTQSAKIQRLLISQLEEHGSIELLLPNRVVLEIGITQEGKSGTVKVDEYCWLTASKNEREISLDSYNLGLRFSDYNSMLLESDMINEDGENIRLVNVV